MENKYDYFKVQSSNTAFSREPHVWRVSRRYWIHLPRIDQGFSLWTRGHHVNFQLVSPLRRTFTISVKYRPCWKSYIRFFFSKRFLGSNLVIIRFDPKDSLNWSYTNALDHKLWIHVIRSIES
jgi:hypothetical protein